MRSQNSFLRDQLLISTLNDTTSKAINAALELEESLLQQSEPIPDEDLILQERRRKTKLLIERVECEGGDEDNEYDDDIESMNDYEGISAGSSASSAPSSASSTAVVSQAKVQSYLNQLIHVQREREEKMRRMNEEAN